MSDLGRIEPVTRQTRIGHNRASATVRFGVMLLAVGDTIKGTCQAPGSEACSHQGRAAFAGNLVLMKKQSMSRLASIHASFTVMRGAELWRQAPELWRKTVALYQS